jgi:hypothetical protein
MDLSYDNIKKGQEIKFKIENVLQNTFNLELKAQEFFVISKNTFKRALMHHCFYDITEINDGLFKVIFVTFSTSKNAVLCGIQKFDKIPLLLDTKYKDFYTIRILFSKNMTKEELIE